MALTDLTLKSRYNPDNCDDIVAEFYRPALAQAVSYDRTTYTFSPNALAAVGRGLESFLLAEGHIRLICNCELSMPVYQAIKEGLAQAPDVLLEIVPPSTLIEYSDVEDKEQKRALNLLTWLVAQGRIEIKVAFVQEGDRIFHEKKGILTDAEGNRLAFSGSANETRAGWSENYELTMVFTDWKEASRVDDAQHDFDFLWENKSKVAIVTPISETHINALKQIAPPRPPVRPPNADAHRYWTHVNGAVRQDPATSVATIPASLWPHQQTFFQKHAHHDDNPVRKLIADEVGLGKTLQAASLLKWRINQGTANRFLILTPAGSRGQWQDELYDRLNISVPIMERRQNRVVLIHPDGTEEFAPHNHWTQPQAIASYHWARRDAAALMEMAQQAKYDVIIIDEAHHARFSEPDNVRNRRQNQYLLLLKSLSVCTRDLLLLTATPMQIAVIDLWALLNLLDQNTWMLPDFERLYDPQLTANRDSWRLARQAYCKYQPRPESLRDEAERVVWSDNETWVNSRLNSQTMRDTVRYMRRNGPVANLMSRHTRTLLREYQKQGYDTAVPDRHVKDEDIIMSGLERELYDEIKPLVASIYGNRSEVNRSALGFINTIFHTRLGSSPHAYACSLQNILNRHFEQQDSQTGQRAYDWEALSDITDDEVDDQPDTEDGAVPVGLNARQIYRLEQNIAKAQVLADTDSKFAVLVNTLDDLQSKGHRLIIIFTQFRDTQAWLESKLSENWKLTCLHGDDKNQYEESRAKRLEWFRQQDKGLLICTESASESLNLQFCSALVNYDIPWNPMKLEQRIGRIDRIGQTAASVDVVNLYYNDTAQWKAYQAVRRRLAAITTSVGPYRPILESNMSGLIKAVIQGDISDSDLDDKIEQLSRSPAPDIDAYHDTAINNDDAQPGVDSEYLHSLVANQSVMPDGWKTEAAGIEHYKITMPNGKGVVVTAKGARYDPDAVKWFGPGSAIFEAISANYQKA